MKGFAAFVRKVLYAVSANLLSLVVSMLSTLIIPKFLGESVDQYGYLQIYIFYANYVGYMHFGLCDGFFLRDGGKQYEDLNRPLYSGQFWLLTAGQTLLTLLIAVGGMLFSGSPEYKFIFLALALHNLIYLPRRTLEYLLQTTNRVREYAIASTVGRVLYGISIVGIALFLTQDFRYFVMAAILSDLLPLFLLIWNCRDLLRTKPAPLRAVLPEAKTNLCVGIKLMLANISSMLVTGIMQWGIQNKWDASTYGRISFTLSVSNLVLAFINAVALVLYPTLRQTDGNRLSGIYNVLRNLLMVPCLGCLVLYYPLELILSAWLPQYAEGMRYMAILFPMCIYAAKTTLLVQTYLNVYRMERTTLGVNLIGVAFATLTMVLSVFVASDLTLAMMCIVLNQMIRCILGEVLLARHMKLSVLKDNLCEIVMTALFIGVSWFIGGWAGEGIYLLGFAVYLLVKRRDIREALVKMKALRGNASNA